MPMIEAELCAAMGDFAYEQRLRKDANLKPNPRPPAHWELSTDFDEEIAERRRRGDTIS